MKPESKLFLFKNDAYWFDLIRDVNRVIPFAWWLWVMTMYILLVQGDYIKEVTFDPLMYLMPKDPLHPTLYSTNTQLNNFWLNITGSLQVSQISINGMQSIS